MKRIANQAVTVLTLALLAGTAYSQTSKNLGAAAAPEEFRAIACSRFEWPKRDLTACKAYIDTLMQRLHDANFNAVIFQMRGQCDTLYPSPYEPWSYILSDDGNAPVGWGDFDPMAYAINKAHENGLEFHAYINAHVIWNNATAPNYAPNHPFWQHGNPNDPAHRDWLCVNSTGTPQGFDGEYVWLAPGVPDFQAYWRKQVMYVVEHYDGSDPVTRPRVDGVHFDRIRTNSTDWSHDPISEARRLGEANPANLSFGDWTRDQITRTLCDLYAQINESHPTVKLSSAPLGMHSGVRYPGTGYPLSDCGYGGYGYSCKYQDPQGWMAAGAQDFICPQIYWADEPWRTTNPHYSAILPDWLNHNSGRHVYAFGNVSATGPGLLSEVAVSRAMSAAVGQGNATGNVFWYYGGFFGLVPPTYAVDLTPLFAGPGGPYAERANVPRMPWKDTPTEGIIIGTVSDGTNPIVDAQVTRSGSTYVALSSADGVYSFLRVPPGTYTLTYVKPGAGTQTIPGVAVVAGQVTRVPEVVLSGPDVTPPIITEVAVQGTTGTQATVTWLTNELSDSRVRFGTTPGDYPFVAGSTVLVTSHSVALANLQPGVTYYTVISSWDAYNNEAQSAAEYQFTTPVTTPDFIVESRAGGQNVAQYSESGTTSFSDSTAKSTAEGCTTSGIGSRFSTRSSAKMTYMYTPSATGSYEVFVTWGTSASGASQVNYVATHAGGSATVVFNQNSSAGLQNQWNSLGVFKLSGGTTYTVVQSLVTSNGSDRLMADAVKWVSAGPAVDAGADQTVVGAFASVQVGGNPTAAGGALPYASYAWTATPSAGTSFDHPDAPNPTFTATGSGVYQVCVTVTDATGKHASDCATITVASSMDMAMPVGATTIKGSSAAGLGSGSTGVAFGDVNGDGYLDAIVGSPTDSGTGSVTILYGSQSFAAKTLIDLSIAQAGSTTIWGAGGMFGAAIATGDVNGDGFDDVIIGAHGYISGSSAAGDVFIVYGQANMATVASIQAATPPVGVVITHIAADRRTPRVAFGWSVATGDLNADGYADVVVGSPMNGPALRGTAGIAYVFYGSASLYGTPLIDLMNAPGTYGETRISIVGAVTREQLGTSLACADLNGDGYDDLLTGAPGATPSGRGNAGAAYVVYGSAMIPSGTIDFVTGATLPAGVMVTRIYGDDASDSCGRAVATGDVNGDGYADMIVGAHLADPPGGVDAGEISIIFGAADLATRDPVDLSDAPPSPPPAPRDPKKAVVTRILGKAYMDHFGWSLAAGDVNGDGLDDVLIGANTADPPDVAPLRVDAGKLYVAYGKTDLQDSPLINLAATSYCARVFGALAGDHLGNAVAGGADINDDGVGDWIVSSPQAGANDGAAYILYGRIGAVSAKVRRHDRAGSVPVRDYGPSVRCSIGYTGTGSSASETTVTLFRDKQVAAFGVAGRYANAFWQVDTTRTGAWTAGVTFRYLDSDVAGLNEGILAVYRADTLAGPFTRVDDAQIDTAKNRVFLVVSNVASSVFALKVEPSWVVSPANDQALGVLQGTAATLDPYTYVVNANTTSSPATIVATADCDWVTLDKAVLSLSAGAASDTVTVAMNDRVRYLAAGQYTCTLTFQDAFDPAMSETRRIVLTILECNWQVVERDALEVSGPVWIGPYSPGAVTLDITNNGDGSLGCKVTADATWVTLTPASGTTINVPAGGTQGVVATIVSTEAVKLSAGDYTCTLTFSTDCATVTKQITLHVTCPAVPTVTSVTPASGEWGQVLNRVSIVGSNFMTGRTTLRFAMAGVPDMAVTNMIFVDNSHLLCDLDLTGVSAGKRDVIVTTCGDGTLVGGFEVNCAMPTVTSVTPALGQLDEVLTGVTIVGSNFLVGKTSVRFAMADVPDLVVKNVAVFDSSHITCDLTLTGAVAGVRDVIVTTCGDATLVGGFAIACTMPTVTSVTPALGQLNEVLSGVSIVGSNFVPGKTTVRFAMAGVPDLAVTNPTVVDDSHITCNLNLTGALAGKRDVIVTTCGAATLVGGFEIGCTLPTVDSVTPALGSLNQILTGVSIVGSNFVPGKTTVRFAMAGVSNLVVGNVAVVDSSHITCDLNLTGASEGKRDVIVTTCGDARLVQGFNVTCIPPTITSVDPPAAQEGLSRQLTIAGSGFVSGTIVKLKKAGRPDIVATGVSAASDGKSLTATVNLVGAEWGKWSLVATTCADSAVKTDCFEVTCTPPSVWWISPATGSQGQKVTVTIAGANFLPGAIVNLLLPNKPDIIHATNVVVSSRSSLRCDFDLPATAVIGQWTVEVQTCACADLVAAFNLTCSIPTATSIAPSSGRNDAVLTGVAISGSNFVVGVNGTTVKLRGGPLGSLDITATNVNVIDAGHLTCTLDLRGAALGRRDLIISTCADGTFLSAFEVTVPCSPPSLMMNGPASGTQGEIVTGVTIPGSDFVPGATTVKLTKASEPEIAATNVQVAPDGTSLTADVDLAFANVGHWDVVVATCGETTAPKGFVVRPTCHTPALDVDDDNDVDLKDFAAFRACFNGTNQPWREQGADQNACACLDTNEDGTVDIIDFSVFRQCFNGSNRPPRCP